MPLEIPVVVLAMEGVEVCMAEPTKNEPSPARMIIAAGTRSATRLRGFRRIQDGDVDCGHAAGSAHQVMTPAAVGASHVRTWAACDGIPLAACGADQHKCYK